MRSRTVKNPGDTGSSRRVGSRARSLIALGAALATGTAAAVLVAGWNVSAQGAGGPADLPGGALQVTNLPPLLRTADDHLAALRYDVTCAAPETDADSGCDIAGTAFVRAGSSGSFQAIPLVADPHALVDRYVASLPADVTSASVFSYYAVVHDNRTGETVTLPAGGAAAPERSLLLTRPVAISLGTHVFGAADHASARVASAPWGDGPGRAGVEDGPQLQPIGATSFDVDAAGTVTVLDEAHRRLLRFDAGRPGSPTAIPVDVRGTIADVRSRTDGGADVLESVAAPGETPVLHSFDASGRATGAWHTAEATASALRLGLNGPQVLEYPAGQWMAIASNQAESGPAARTAQLDAASVGPTLSGGRSIVAQREGAEARIALVDARGVTASWRIKSSTPLAEIQLAEPIGTKVVVVLRTYTEASDEFVALVLGPRGAERQVSIASRDWAETAPLSRFRLVGSALYHLGSTPTGMFVDRFDLEVH